MTFRSVNDALSVIKFVLPAQPGWCRGFWLFKIAQYILSDDICDLDHLGLMVSLVLRNQSYETWLVYRLV